MRFVQVGVAAAVMLSASAGVARAETKPVSFSKEIVPLLRDQCIKCHGSRQPQGGLSLATFAALEKGGRGGKVLAPKADESRLVKYLDGRLQPKMPIGGSLTPAQLATVKAWIDQGAKADVDKNTVVIPDSAAPAVQVPKIKVKVPVLPQVASLAWSKDGKVLAAGTYKVVKLINPETGQVIRDLDGHAEVINALQFSRSGKLIAAAGGLPSQQGEIKIWEVETGKLVRTITGHNDCIYSISWGAEDKTIASGSYDKLIKIWDVETGNEVKTLKDHADAVYAVAFNPAGNLLVSGGADRSVKTWDVATGKRLQTLAGHGDTVCSLAWNPAGTQVTSVGADKTIRTWNVNAAGAGNQARNVTGHDKAIQDVAYSADGNMVATASDDHSVKIWNAGNGSAVKTISDLADGALSVAFSADGKLLAVGGFDGTLSLYTVADGKLAKAIFELPKPAPKPEAAKPAEAKPEAAKTEPKKP